MSVSETRLLAPALRPYLRPCLRCGHDSRSHRIIFPRGAGVLALVGAIHEARIGGCDHGKWTLLECVCPGYTPDRLSRVSDLLGLDVRKVVGA